MATYIHVKTKTYPLYEADIRRRHKNVSFPQDITPELLKDFGYEVVIPTAKPEGDVVSMGPAVYDKGEDAYYQTWNVREYNNDEKKSIINADRERRLRDGIEYTFPNGQVDRIQVSDRDLTILQSIELRASRNLETEGYEQIFRSKGNSNYILTAQQVLDMTTHVFQEIERIYVDSWADKK